MHTDSFSYMFLIKEIVHHLRSSLADRSTSNLLIHSIGDYEVELSTTLEADVEIVPYGLAIIELTGIDLRDVEHALMKEGIGVDNLCELEDVLLNLIPTLESDIEEALEAVTNGQWLSDIEDHKEYMRDLEEDEDY